MQFLTAFRPVIIPLRSYSAQARDVAKWYRVLGLPLDSDQESVRVAFIELVKRFHPDSKSSEADSAKFQEIEKAYRSLLEKFANERFNKNEGEGEYGLYYEEKEEEQEQDIEHTAPQHRQYLSHGGFGSGTPFQREKQYSQFRAAKAAQSVTEYRVSRIVNEDSKEVQKRGERKKVKDIRTGLGMDRLVEDLIQESMTRGEFDNLPGTGKPLKCLNTTRNPYVDFTTQKMNEVLIDNGFTPQWITLSKEIRESKESIRNALKTARAKLGPLPLSAADSLYWTDKLDRLAYDSEVLNAKIDFFNLIVPILNKQMTHFDLPFEASQVLEKSMFKKPDIEISDETVVKEENKIINRILNYLLNK